MSKNEITHTTKAMNEYFTKLKYIVDNFEKLEKRVLELENEIKKITKN